MTNVDCLNICYMADKSVERYLSVSKLRVPLVIITVSFANKSLYIKSYNADYFKTICLYGI